MIGMGRMFITVESGQKIIVWLCFVLTVVSMPSKSIAQYSENISSDRPGMSYSANTVGARVVQFQVGGQFFQSTQTSNFGNGFIGGAFDGAIRVGIIERLEIGFSTVYLKRISEQASFNSNVQEIVRWGISVRGNVLKSNGRTPNIGLFAQVVFPDKETPQFSESIAQHFRVLIEQPLESRIKLTSNIGLYRDRFAHFLYTLNLCVDISPSTTIFVEHFGQYTQTYDRVMSWPPEYEMQRHYYVQGNGGFAFRLMSNIQLDVEAGYGNWAIAPALQQDWYLNLGLSWRARIKKKIKETVQ